MRRRLSAPLSGCPGFARAAVCVADRERVQAGSGIAITLPDNNQEIASQIGTVRELVSRNLSRLQAEGMIEIDGRKLTIRNLDAIKAEVSSAE